MRALVLLAVLSSPPETPAEASQPNVQRPRTLQLDWTAPPSCPDIDEVRDRLRARLPSVDEPLAPGGAPLEAKASLTPGIDGFDVDLRLTHAGRTSERVISSRDCSLLTDAAVLVIAVTLDPVATAIEVSRHEVEVSPRPPAETPPPVEDVRPVEPPAAPNERAEPTLSTSRSAAGGSDDGDLRFGLRVLGGGGFGPTNTAYATLGGSLAALGDRWRVAADGRWIPRRSVTQPDGAGGQFDAWLVGAVGCFVPSVRAVELPLCAGVEGGQIRGRGIPTLAVVDQATLPHVALRVAPGVAWAPIERLALGFDLELAVPLTRGEFVVDDVVVQRIAPVNVRGVVGIELRLP